MVHHSTLHQSVIPPCPALPHTDPRVPKTAYPFPPGGLCLVQLTDFLQQGRKGLQGAGNDLVPAEGLLQALPALGLGLLYPVQQIRREEGSLSVIAMIIWADGTALRWCVEPALGSQVAADFGFVDNFVMDGHEGKPIGYDGFVDGATSFIWDLRG